MQQRRAALAAAACSEACRRCAVQCVHQPRVSASKSAAVWARPGRSGRVVQCCSTSYFSVRHKTSQQLRLCARSVRIRYGSYDTQPHAARSARETVQPRGMKKKKKLSRKPLAPVEDDAMDEREALSAIYGDAFQLAADGSAFSVLVKALDVGGDAPGEDHVDAPAVRVVRVAAWSRPRHASPHAHARAGGDAQGWLPAAHPPPSGGGRRPRLDRGAHGGA